MSGSAAARCLGIPVSTFNENRRAGVIGGGGKTRGSRGERDRRDREAPMGRATHDVAGRVLAMTGQMEEARPTFGELAHGVAGGGVLAGLPMLLREGLLGAASRLLGVRPEAGRSPTARTATGPASEGPGELHRSGVADHAVIRRLCAGVQRSGDG